MVIFFSFFMCVFFSWYFDFVVVGWFLGFCFFGTVFLLGDLGFFGVFVFDPISVFLVFLVFFVLVGCFFSDMVEKWLDGVEFYYFLVFFIFFCLFVCFGCSSLLLFYIFFEFIFIVMFVFLLGWGFNFERLQASFYMVFYTVVVSLPFLVFLIFEGDVIGSLTFWFFFESCHVWIGFVFLVFLVKLPVYGVHLWLPKAHVEAPVTGSMVLAGVLLKLGGYGLLRFGTFFNGFSIWFSSYFISIGLVGGVYSCFLCLRQIDLKAFVAYSSVFHMGVALTGFFCGSSVGATGGIMMLIAHGFCSSCLFYILYIFYERFHSRSIFVLKGLFYLFPLMGFIWFFFSVLNMGVPPFMSFFSEVFILVGCGSTHMFTFVFLGMGIFWGGVYGIYLFVLGLHGSFLFDGVSVSLSVREFLVFFVHFFPLVWVCVYFSIFLYA